MRWFWLFSFLVFPAAAAIAQAPVDELRFAQSVTRLSSPDFRERERGGTELLAYGDAAIPLVKAAMLSNTDPEAVQRLGRILNELEARWLAQPRRVTYQANQKNAKDLFQELTRQTGYKFQFPKPLPKTLVNVNWQGMPFLQAIDNICELTGCSNETQDIDGTYIISDTDKHDPHVAYSGPFRIVAANVSSNRQFTLNGLARRMPNQPPVDYLQLVLNVNSEPKASMCGISTVVVLKAMDDKKNSLSAGDEPVLAADGMLNKITFETPVPSFRTYSLSASLGLIRADRRAEKLSEIRGKLAVSVLVGTKPVAVIDNLAGQEGKTIESQAYSIKVGKLGVNGAFATIDVTFRRKHGHPDEFNWVQLLPMRLEAYDAEGRPLRFAGIDGQSVGPNFASMTFQYLRPTGQRPPKIAKLQFVDWTVKPQEIDFTLKDIPLP
jgi:hypothetical protein